MSATLNVDVSSRKARRIPSVKENGNVVIGARISEVEIDIIPILTELRESTILLKKRIILFDIAAHSIRDGTWNFVCVNLGIARGRVV